MINRAVYSHSSVIAVTFFIRSPGDPGLERKGSQSKRPSNDSIDLVESDLARREQPEGARISSGGGEGIMEGTVTVNLYIPLSDHWHTLEGRGGRTVTAVSVQLQDQCSFLHSAQGSLRQSPSPSSPILASWATFTPTQRSRWWRVPPRAGPAWPLCLLRLSSTKVRQPGTIPPSPLCTRYSSYASRLV